VDRFTVHYTPKHASGESSEIAISLFSRNLGQRRLESRDLRKEARSLNRRHQSQRVTIQWALLGKRPTQVRLQNHASRY